MSGLSSIDSLQRLARVSDVDAAAVFGTPGREDLLDHVVRAPLGRRPLGRQATRSRRPLVVAVALVVAAATAATAWAILRSSAHETTSIECVIKGTDTIVPAVSGDPAYDCAVVWQNDVGTVPPPLAAYDNGHGGVSVIPSADKPESGWTRLAGGQDAALIELQESLDDYIAGLNSSCLSANAATALAESKLARLGLTGWTVTVRQQGACTNAEVIDPASKTVTLIPIGAVAGPGTTSQKLAGKLRPIANGCATLSAAVASVRAAASSLGLSQSARTYELQTVTDNSRRCASVYETVGGTIFVTVRGPAG